MGRGWGSGGVLGETHFTTALRLVNLSRNNIWGLKAMFLTATEISKDIPIVAFLLLVSKFQKQEGGPF